MHQWSMKCEKRAERARLRMLMDGHPQGCECENCSGTAPVLKCLWDDLDEGRDSQGQRKCIAEDD